MAKSKSVKASSAAVVEDTSALDTPPLEKAAPDRATNEKRRELLETRIRWKIADETVRRVMEERKELRARIEALSAELAVMAPQEPSST
jgi:hypothetical protein